MHGERMRSPAPDHPAQPSTPAYSETGHPRPDRTWGLAAYVTHTAAFRAIMAADD